MFSISYLDYSYQGGRNITINSISHQSLGLMMKCAETGVGGANSGDFRGDGVKRNVHL